MEKFSKPYVSFKNGYIKCFTQDIPMFQAKHIQSFVIRMTKEVFLGRFQQPFQTFFHFPRQLLTSLPTRKRWYVKKRDTWPGLKWKFIMRHLDVIKYRQKRRPSCLAAAQNYNENVANQTNEYCAKLCRENLEPVAKISVTETVVRPRARAAQNKVTLFI